MNAGPSPVQLMFSLIAELTGLMQQPRRGIDPGIITLETLNDEVRSRLNGVIVEAKLILDRNLSPLNEFSNALSLLRVPGAYPTPLEVQDLLQRALRYMDTSESAGPLLAPSAPAVVKDNFVHADRLAELRLLRSKQWDLRRLIRLCEELNIAHHNNCTMTVGMLIRAIKDHCPPIFGCTSFSHVANNASGFSKSRRAQLQRLDKSLTDIADGFLHEHIRKHEALPSSAQIAFGPEVDALLIEITVAVKQSGNP